MPFYSDAQNSILMGRVLDEKSKMPLQSVSITIYGDGKVSGNITNNEGKFMHSNTTANDSIKFSMIRYGNKVITPPFNAGGETTIKMEAKPVQLAEVFVQPMSAYELVQKAVVSTTSFLPHINYENTLFYREIIKNKADYFSVAEAIFNTQYASPAKSYKLRLIKASNIVDRFEENVGAAKKILENADETAFMNMWHMQMSGQDIMPPMPKVVVARSFLFNHLYHHRGELGAHLRATGNTIPGLYGPTYEETQVKMAQMN